MGLVDLAARLFGEPVMAASIGVERTKQSLLLDDLFDPQKAGCRPLLIDEKHRILLVCGVIHGDDQVPILARNPLMRACVLMEHHTDHRRRGPSLAMLALALGLFHQSGPLQCVLYPAVASPPCVYALVKTIKMLDIPTPVSISIQAFNPYHFIHWGSSV